MKLEESVASCKEHLLASLQEIIKIRSVQDMPTATYPYGADVGKCLEITLDIAKKMGFSTYNMDNHIGWCEYGTGDEMIAILGHLDIVPEGDHSEWHFDPFGGKITDGKIYGRGAMDDKGPLMASLYALYAIKKADLPLKRRIRILFGTNEETGSADMKYYREHGGELPLMGFTPDGDYPVIHGEKGIINVTYERDYHQDSDIRIVNIDGGTAINIVPDKAIATISCPLDMTDELISTINSLEKKDQIICDTNDNGFTITAFGLSAHGANPELGINAIGLLMMALSKLPLSKDLLSWIDFINDKIGLDTKGTNLGINLSDDISGSLSFNLGKLDADDSHVSLMINYRYPVTKSYDDCAPILDNEFIQGAFIKTHERHSKALYIPEESSLVQTLLSVYREKTKDNSMPKVIGGGTYAKSIPNIVAFGPVFPGDEVREHMPDEYIEIDRLMMDMEIYAKAMYKLAN